MPATMHAREHACTHAAPSARHPARPQASPQSPHAARPSIARHIRSTARYTRSTSRQPTTHAHQSPPARHLTADPSPPLPISRRPSAIPSPSRSDTTARLRANSPSPHLSDLSHPLPLHPPHAPLSPHPTTTKLPLSPVTIRCYPVLGLTTRTHPGQSSWWGRVVRPREGPQTPMNTGLSGSPGVPQ